jgi:hypothetical protein
MRYGSRNRVHSKRGAQTKCSSPRVEGEVYISTVWKNGNPIKDIQHMSMVMQNWRTQKEFCKFLDERGTEAYMTYFRDLDEFQRRLRDHYSADMLLSEAHSIRSEAINIPVLEYDPESISANVHAILNQSRYQLEKLKLKKIVTFLSINKQIAQAQDILLVELLEEFREFIRTPVYQTFISSTSGLTSSSSSLPFEQQSLS